MKIVNRIIVSETEPESSNMWIDGKEIKLFGPKGWKSLNDNKEIKDLIESLQDKVEALEEKVTALESAESTVEK